MEVERERESLHLIVRLKYVLNLGTLTQVKYEDSLEDDDHNKVKHKRQRFYPVVRPMPTSHCGDLLRSRVALNPSQVIQRSNLSTTIFFLISSFSFMRNLHKLESLMPYTNDLNQSTRVMGSSNTHKNSNRSNTRTRVKKRAQETTQRSYNSTMCSNLYLANQQRGHEVSML
jgi:hypothetical protein